MPTKLDSEAIERHLQQLDGWEAPEEKLRKTFEFDDFVRAMEFVNRMAGIAEAEEHHPDFCVHYNEVEVTIWTHSIDGLSEADFGLAKQIDALVS